MIIRALLTVLITLALVISATINGILQPTIRQFDIALLAIAAVGWWVVRGRRPLHASRLDGAFLLGAIAIGVSLLLNGDQWRRIATGIWFVGLYAVVFYTTYDLIRQRRLTREAVIDALLIAGVTALLFGGLQLRDWVSIDLPRWLSGEIASPPPRVVGTLGNANTYGSLLALLLPLVVTRLVMATRWLSRIGLGLYALAAGGLLLITYSRGAWLGALAGVIAGLLLMTFASGTPLLRLLHQRWAGLETIARLGIAAVGTAITVALAAVGIVAIDSLATPGRSLDARTWLWETALVTLRDHPIAGDGLFTFGAALAGAYGSPPFYEPHSHAHNLVLHVGAELGILGLAALALFAWAILRATIASTRDPAARMTSAAVGGALVAVGVHHLLDVPAMLPALALVSALLLAVSAAGDPPPQSRRGGGLLLAFVWAALILTGGLTSAVYSDYWSVVTKAAGSGDYAQGARDLDPVIARDPDVATYWYAQGMLAGLGDDPARARAAFARFTALEPTYVSGWVNLAVSSAAVGDQDAAAEAWARAATIAPLTWSIHAGRGAHAESIGDQQTAASAYARALTVNPDVQLSAFWEDTPLRREVRAAAAPLTIWGVTVQALSQRQAALIGADDPLPPMRLGVETAIRGLIALRAGDRERADIALQTTQRSFVGDEDAIWTLILAAEIARLDGRDAQARDLTAQARALRDTGDLNADWAEGANIFYTQSLRLAIPRLFLPQAHIDMMLTGTLIDHALAQMP